MRSIPWAMTWELLHRRPWSLIGVALGAIALPTLVMSVLHFEGPVDPRDASQIMLHFVLMQVNMFLLGAAVFASQEHPLRLYTLPLPTSVLVAWQLLPSMALVLLLSLVSTVFLNSVFLVNWPVWGPALFVAAALAVINATVWLTQKSGWVVVALTLVSTVLGLWLKSRFGSAFSRPTRIWPEPTAGEVVTMLAAAALAYGAGVWAVGRHRRGEPLRSLGIVAWLQRTFDQAPQPGLPFRGPADAQFWFEWEKKGWVMPAGLLMGMLMWLIVWVCASRDPAILWEGAKAGGVVLLLLGQAIAFAVGNVGPKDDDYAMGNFLATRPIGSTDLARTILRVIAKSVFMSWILWLVVFLALGGVLMFFGQTPWSSLWEGLPWWYLPATLVGAWTVVAVIATAGLMGHWKPCLQVFCLLVTLFLAVSLVSKYTLTEQGRDYLWSASVIASGVLLVVGTAWVFATAHLRQLIGPQTVNWSITVWGAVSALIALEWSLHGVRDQIPLYILALGLAALAVGPLAAAPLAIAWNRHR